jgi:hypothetical protein
VKRAILLHADFGDGKGFAGKIKAKISEPGNAENLPAPTPKARCNGIEYDRLAHVFPFRFRMVGVNQIQRVIPLQRNST